MNRKTFSLVTGLAILTSSLSPTWAAGKDFTYNNLNQNLPIKAQVDETKAAEENIDLPLVTETLPDESVRDKYARIIFIPETKKINGVMEYGKLVDEYGNNIPTNENSSDEEKSKTFYVLKSATWSDVLKYKEDGKLILPKLVVENNESDPEKKKIHKFLGWSLSNNLRDPFNLKKYKKVSDIGTSDTLEFKSRFENLPYFYGTVRTPVYDPDGYKVEEFSKRYNYNEFTSFSYLSRWRGQLSPNEKQKEFADPKDFPSKRIYFYFKKNSGTYKFGDYKPSIVNEKNNTFWYWCYDGAHGNIAWDSFDMNDNAREFKAIFINKFFRIPDNIDFEKLPLPEGIFVVKLEAENGYTVEGLTFTRNAVRGGVSLAEVTSIPKEPELIDENNVKYEGKVAWYYGYKKINNPSEFKINSDIVLTARPVKDYESEKFTAQVKKIEVNKGEDVTLEKLKTGIINLPKNLDKIEIKTYPDTSEVGEGKATLKLIFTDTSSKEVEIPVRVIEKISGGAITPIPKINDEDIIKEEVPYNGQINLLDNIKNLPDGAEVEDISDPIDTKVPGTYKGKVKVIFKDGSSRIVVIPVEVSEALSYSYTPQVKKIEVNKGEDVTLEKLKTGIINLPKNLDKIEIKTYPDTSEVGESKATLKLIFTDTSSNEVVIPVKVINIIDAGIVTPVPEIKVEDIIKEEVPYHGEINLLDNIKNLSEGAEVEDISDTISTKISGTYTGKVRVTFKDGSSRIVEIPIEVLAPMAEKFPVQNPVKTQVENLENINSTEKSEIEEKVREANPQVVSIEVDDRGNVTLIYEDGSSNLIKAEDVIILREKTPEEEEPEEKPADEDNKDPEGTPGEEDEDPEVIPEEGDKDSEDKPGEVGDKDPEEKQGEKDNKDPEENPKDTEEEDNKKTENKRGSWNDFPRYYVRNHRTPTYKVETKITYKESKSQVNSKKFVINMKTGTYTTIEDGKTLERAMEVKPLIKDDRTFLPLRALADILDAKVIWNEGTRTASFTREGITALIQIDGKKIVLSNGKTIELESKPLNINGRIYLPLVNVGQVFGLTSGNSLDGEDQDIEWDDMDKTVTINIK